MLHAARHIVIAMIGLAAAGAACSAPPDAASPTAAAAVTSPAASIDQQSLLTRLERGDPSLVLLDVRTAEEFAAGHVPGARNISHDVLAGRIDELADARDRDLVVYCRSGRRSGIALDLLRSAGFTRLVHLEGDWLGWEAAGRPIAKTSPSTAATQEPVRTPGAEAPPKR